VENVENSVDSRSTAKYFLTCILENNFYSFYDGYFRDKYYTVSLYQFGIYKKAENDKNITINH